MSELETKGNFGIIDLTKEITAKTLTKCDACGATLGQGYASKKGSINVMMPDGEDDQGYSKNKMIHTCDAKCLKDYMNKNH